MRFIYAFEPETQEKEGIHGNGWSRREGGTRKEGVPILSEKTMRDRVQSKRRGRNQNREGRGGESAVQLRVQNHLSEFSI